MHEEVVVIAVHVVVAGHLVHVEAWDDLLVLVVGSIGDDRVLIWRVVADVVVYVGAVRVQGSRVAGLDELGDAAGAADRDAEGQKVAGGVDDGAAFSVSLGESETLVLAESAVEVTVVIVPLVLHPVVAVGTGVLVLLVDELVPVLGGHGETTSDTVETAESKVVKTTTSGLLVVVVLDDVDGVDGCLDVGHVNGGVVHHLFTAGGDTDDLTELGALFDEAVELLADTFDNISTSGKIATVAVAGPVVDGAPCASGVAVALVTAVTVAAVDGVGAEVVLGARTGARDHHLEGAKLTGIVEVVVVVLPEGGERQGTQQLFQQFSTPSKNYLLTFSQKLKYIKALIVKLFLHA